MANPSEFPDLGDLASIHRKRLMDLVAKTPLSMGDFERLVGWDFIKDAPQKKKELAWAVLQTKEGGLKLLSELRKAFPEAYITEIRNGDSGIIRSGVGYARPDGGA